MKSISILSLLLIASASFAQTITGFLPASVEKEGKAESYFLNLQENERYKNHLKNLTKEPHVTGTPGNERVRDYLVKIMKTGIIHNRSDHRDYFYRLELLERRGIEKRRP